MKKTVIRQSLVLTAILSGALGQAMEEPTNYPPSPVDSNTAPYAHDPAQVDTNATAKPDDNTTKADLEQRIATVVKFISALQGGSDTQIPTWIINQAKGVVIFHCWRGSILVGGAGGWGIGMRKMAGGFSNPIFYRVEGASVGAQAGASEIDTVAFLLSDKAMKTLTDNKLVWGGNLHAIAGTHSATFIAQNVDVVLYQKASGLDVGASFAAAKLIADKSSNRIFYGLDLTPEQIFTTDVQTSGPVKSLAESLIKAATAPNGSLSLGAH